MKKPILIIIGIIIFLNLLFINYKLFFEKDPETSKQTISIKTSEKDGETIISETDNTLDPPCGPSCQDTIKQATASLSLTSKTGGTTPSAPSSTGVKEFFIPLGSGSSTASTWTNVPGLQAYVNPSDYGNIDQVFFQASITVPTGNQTVQARLFNVTAQHPVWFSDVSMSGGTPQLLISQPITLDSGSNLYQVQMQTQLQYQAILDQARIRITVD